MYAWEKTLRQITPYVPGEQSQETEIIKLNTNENPYPPSPRVTEALTQFNAALLRRYPDANMRALVSAIAQQNNRKETEVFTGVGSDDVLAMAFLACFHSQKPILFPDITYSFYEVWAQLFEIPYETIPLDESFRLHREDYIRENGGIVLANPNAPTSIYEPLDSIAMIAEQNQESVVIVDEAYIAFAPESALTLIDQYPNILVVRTLSKSHSMAGMRIGYAIGNPRLICALNDVKNSYNSYTLNAPAIAAGAAAVSDTAYNETCVAKLLQTREEATRRFAALGFQVLPSSTNFLFMTHPKQNARQLMEKLRARNIFVRWFSAPRISQYLRVTIGTPEEMERLFAVLTELLAT